MPKNKANDTDLQLPILGQAPLQPKGSKQAGNLKTGPPKTGRGRIRAAVLIAVHIAILLHLTHYWIAGRSVSPVEPSEVMETIEVGKLNAGAIFFAIAIVSTLLFGRFFCGWGCHVVALQDLSSHMLRRVGLRPKPLRSRLLTIVPFALAFYMFFWPTLKRLVRGDTHPGFSNHLMTEDFWRTFPGPFIAILTFVVCGGVIVYLLGNKGFCTYACPYGAVFSIADRLAIGRIRVTDDCSHCGQCTAHCTSNVLVHKEVRDFGMVIDPGCMKCMDCVSVCPNDALYFGLTQKAGSRKSNKQKNDAKPPAHKKTYDFSLSEELFGLVITALTVYAVRGIYDGPGLLLAVAVGVLTAYMAIQFFRIFRKRDLRIQRHKLKSGNRVTGKGKWVIAVLCMWFAFTVHSFFVQYHRYRGREHLNQIQATWAAVLDGKAQPKFTEQDRSNIRVALKSYRMTDRLGIIDVLEVKLGLAVASAMTEDLDATESYLRQAYQCNPTAVREMIIEFFAANERQDEAAEFRTQN